MFGGSAPPPPPTPVVIYVHIELSSAIYSRMARFSTMKKLQVLDATQGFTYLIIAVSKMWQWI